MRPRNSARSCAESKLCDCGATGLTVSASSRIGCSTSIVSPWRAYQLDAVPAEEHARRVGDDDGQLAGPPAERLHELAQELLGQRAGDEQAARARVRIEQRGDLRRRRS